MSTLNRPGDDLDPLARDAIMIPDADLVGTVRPFEPQQPPAQVVGSIAGAGPSGQDIGIPLSSPHGKSAKDIKEWTTEGSWTKDGNSWKSDGRSAKVTIIWHDKERKAQVHNNAKEITLTGGFIIIE